MSYDANRKRRHAEKKAAEAQQAYEDAVEELEIGVTHARHPLDIEELEHAVEHARETWEEWEDEAGYWAYQESYPES